MSLLPEVIVDEIRKMACIKKQNHKCGNNFIIVIRTPINENYSEEISIWLLNCLQQINHKVEAWMKGKKVFLTIENPVKSETNKPFIRVPAEHVWKKYEPYRMKQTSE